VKDCTEWNRLMRQGAGTLVSGPALGAKKNVRNGVEFGARR
jgi:hypothetical protein